MTVAILIGSPGRGYEDAERVRRAGSRPPSSHRVNRRLEALRRLDLAADQQRPERVHRLDERLRHTRADLADRDAVVPEIEDGIADAPAALLASSVERTEAATAGDLEDHPRALRDLVERELLALVLSTEVLRE